MRTEAPLPQNETILLIVQSLALETRFIALRYGKDDLQSINNQYVILYLSPVVIKGDSWLRFDYLIVHVGIDPNNDGGGLFAAAVTIWVSMIALLAIRRDALFDLICDLGRAFVPGAPAAPRMVAPTDPATAKPAM